MRPTLLISALLGVACGRSGFGVGQPGSDDNADGGDFGTTTDGPGYTETTGGSTGQPCDPGAGECVVEVSLRRAVDILFIVDNSGSMGGEQGTLAQSFGSFINVLEAQQVGANYRIGITTTEGFGNLRATSCRSRLHEFIFEWPLGTIDERQRGCLDVCEHDTLQIPDPWVEKSGGQTNLPAGVGMAAALQCVGPQGINGTGFERHLESMLAALQDETSEFLREDALLAVIFVTDEADCSMSDQNQFWITSPDGQVFWTSPDGATSGVCWSAGVACTGGPGVYESCFAQDKAMNGLATSDPSAAVMYSLDRYIDALAEIAQQKQILGGQGEALVAVLSGVPLDYPETGVLVYQDSFDPEFNSEFGIGPGCNMGAETIVDPPGIPPVRLREFAEAFATDSRNLFSICADDYGIALEEIAAAIGDVNERACVAGCVADEVPQTPDLDPSCTLIERFAPDAGQQDHPVDACVLVANSWDFPAPDVDVCYRPLTDANNTTPTPLDDQSPQCMTIGSNLELQVQRRPGVPIPAGTVIDVVCTLLGQPGQSCDEI